MTIKVQELIDFTVKEYGDNTFELIKNFPYLVSYIKGNITAEMRDYIIDNYPEEAIHIPDCFITIAVQDKYVINSLRNGIHPDNIKPIGNMPFSYKSKVLLLKSGYYNNGGTVFTERENTKFISAILKEFRNKEVSSMVIWNISYNYGMDIIKHYHEMISKVLSVRESINLAQLFTILSLNDLNRSEVFYTKLVKTCFDLVDKVYKTLPSSRKFAPILMTCYFEEKLRRAKDKDVVIYEILKFSDVNTYEDFNDYIKFRFSSSLTCIMCKERVWRDIKLKDGIFNLYCEDLHKYRFFYNLKFKLEKLINKGQ